jgi:signal transduction histidine kinase
MATSSGTIDLPDADSPGWATIALSHTRGPLPRWAWEAIIRAAGVIATFLLAWATGVLGTDSHQVVLIAIVAVTAGAARRPPWLRYVAVLLEAGVVAVIVLSAPAGFRPSAVYLIIPPIIAAVMAGTMGALAAGLVSALILVIGVVWQQGSDLPEPMADIVIWLAIAIALGLGTALARHIRERVAPTQNSYAAARTLLAALHEVTRRLPEGLEEPVLARTTLETVARILPHDEAAVYVRTRSGTMVAATDSDHPVPWVPRWDRGLWAQVTEANTAIQRPGPLGGSLFDPDWTTSPHHGVASAIIPLRLDGEPIGVVALQRSGTLWPIADLARAQREVDAAALRLDAARLFDEIRDLATTTERQRMSREIHDGIAQELAGLGLLVDDLTRDEMSDDVRARLIRLREELTRIVTELRLSIFDLRLDSGAGIADTLAAFLTTVGNDSGLTVHTVIDEDGARMPVGVAPQVLRIAQESITNARRHAQARTLWVTYRVDEEGIMLRVADDGRGIDEQAMRQDSFGLMIMRERAQSLGGDLTVRPRPGGGTVVELAIGPSILNRAPGSGGQP